ncbi:MAG TPA: hypothetical protein VLK84_23935 [Longimicrobium sp.]|nr:hypothetical protein [Longimicrobium sp.]
MHTQAARGAARGRRCTLRSGRGGDEGQTAEQQGTGREPPARATRATDDRRDESSRDVHASGNA